MTLMPYNTPSIELWSDFRDYYDHRFAGSWQRPGVVFSRNTTDGPTRPQMLKLLAGLGLAVPRHGRMKDLYAAMLKDSADKGLIHELISVVVYTDVEAHGGEGKIKLPLLDALKQYPEHFACEYIPVLLNGLGQSLRYLRIGTRQFWLRYTSHNDWRSNCGEVEIDVLCEERPCLVGQVSPVLANAPLMAIDFLHANRLYAVDFNVSPGLTGTGIEDVLTPTEVFNEISGWMLHSLKMPLGDLSVEDPKIISRTLYEGPEALGSPAVCSEVPKGYAGPCRLEASGRHGTIICALPSFQEARRAAVYAVSPDGGYGFITVHPCGQGDVTHTTWEQWALAWRQG